LAATGAHASRGCTGRHGHRPRPRSSDDGERYHYNDSMNGDDGER
jgi:hypothetical protein